MKQNSIMRKLLSGIGTGKPSARQNFFTLDVSKNFNKPFTGVKITKGMDKRSALKQIYNLMEDAGVSATVFGKIKPNFTTMPASQVETLLTKINNLINS
jgi:hypothetical protein